MLTELHIENLAVITRAELVLKPGLNVITGETGAGKTILAQAIALLLGSRADTSLVRPGAAEASVEAVFSLPVGIFADLTDSLDLPDDDFLAVRRKLSRDGRSRAFVGGRSVSLAVLEQITSRLLKFSAQHQQRRLMLASHQLDLLDAFGGEPLLDRRRRYRESYEQRSRLLAQLDQLSAAAAADLKEAELLEFQVDEIEAAQLTSGEDQLLLEERQRLLAAAELKEASREAAACLGAWDSDQSSPMDALARALARLEAAAGSDAELGEIGNRLRGSFLELEEVGRSAREYAGSVVISPERLAEVEERLDLIAGLKRKYGASLDEVLAFAGQASERLAQQASDAAGQAALEQELAAVAEELLDLAFELRQLRVAAAQELAAQTSAHLTELSFKNSGFEARLKPVEEGGALAVELLGPNGAESLEFYVGLNPGMPAAPLKETASGGELSRIMLAIMSAISQSREVATLVFDEIDAGIGGETGAAVGAKLKGLAASAQLICITHLPQIACYADAHFSVAKSAGADFTETSVSALSGDQVVDELCRMMGSQPGDQKARAHAGSLLKKARPA